MKLEIESDKVDNLQDFRAKKHIHGVPLRLPPKGEAFEYRQSEWLKNRLQQLLSSCAQ